MAANPVAWFEIYVDDLQRAKTFYEAVLAVELGKLDDPTGGKLQMLTFTSNMEQYGATGRLLKWKAFLQEAIAHWFISPVKIAL